MNRIVPSRSITVGLVQINNSFSGQNYLPYSVALLQSYASANLAPTRHYRFLAPIYARIPIGQAVDRLGTADVVGFSTYVWNIRISLEIARRLKSRRPNTLILMGGPQVPDRSEEFLRANPFVDAVVHGEGEQTFTELLESYPEREWRDVAGISFLDAAGAFVKTAPRERLRDLMDVPSPFLSGTLDQLVADNPDETWIGLWETNRGCPFRCTYCDWGSAVAAKVTKFDVERLKKEVDWFSRNKIEFIFCCDANFGMLPRDVDLARYVADVKGRTGYPTALSVQNTKNATERAYLTQKILADAGLNKGVALSLQSINKTALENIKRDNISLEMYLELQRRFTRDRVETYSDLILGLPGETYDSFIDGLNEVIETGQHNRIQFNNLSILPNAEMGDPDYMRKFRIETVESEIINIHGSRAQSGDDVSETQQLVVATYSLPREDWRRVRAVSWMAAFLHFDKLLQMPLILAAEHSDLTYRNMFEAFMEVRGEDFPVLGEIRDFFLDEARRIQEGGSEYVYSADWLGIYWPADEYMYIRLTAEGKLPLFYKESLALISGLLGDGDSVLPQGALEDAVRLNGALMKQPFVADDIHVDLDHDVAAFCDGIRQGIRAPLKAGRIAVRVSRSNAYYANFNDWCREVVWWGNKKGAYLYNTQIPEKQLAGHY